MCMFQDDFQTFKLYSSDQQSDRGHNDIAYQRRDDLTEGASDNDTDSHVYNIATHGKSFEFF